MTNDKAPAKRDGFRTKWGFILACIGSAVGMGNIWMFPQRVSKYGSGTFLIPTLSSYSSSPPPVSSARWALAAAPAPAPSAPLARPSKTVGSAPAGRRPGPGAGAWLPGPGDRLLHRGGLDHEVHLGAFSGATLNPPMVDVEGVMTGGVPALGAAFGATATSFGNNMWLWIGLVAVFAILIFGVGNGIEKANKIMMPLFFFLFLGWPSTWLSSRAPRTATSTSSPSTSRDGRIPGSGCMPWARLSSPCPLPATAR